MKKFIALIFLLVIACGVEPETEHASIQVVRYTGESSITEEGAWKTEWPEGPVRKWSAQVAHDTVTIERLGFCGDECSEIYRLVLVDAVSSLPQFISCTYIANHIFPQELTITDSLMAGVIEIQDWVLDGVISGRVQGEWLQGDSWSFIFWVNLAENGG